MDAVQDENARIVLRAIVDGLNVRNGATGAGDMAFVTRGELEGSQSALSMGISRQIDDYTTQVRKITPGMISQVINDLQAQIMESKLFKDLGERVNLIDKPGGIFERLGNAETTLVHEQNLRVEGDTGLSQRIDVMGVRVGNAEVVITNEVTQRINGDTALSTRIDQMGTRVGTAEAAISTETTQRVNADNAIQQTISTQYAAVNNNLSLLQSSQTTTANNVAALTTTMQQVRAQVGANAVAIQQETQARAAADGTLYAQWTLRVDVGGRVSGFGLASSQNVSDFIVRADRFSIASPSTQAGIQPKMPFIVTTTNQIVNGREVPPGVWIEDAFIANGTITRAMIGVAEIDTLVLAGNAVTQPVVVVQDAYQEVATNNPDPNLFTSVAWPLTVDMGNYSSGAMSVLVMISFLPVNFSGGGWSSAYRVVNENTGSVLFSGVTSTGNNLGGSPATSFYIVSVGPGVQRFRLQVRNYGDINGASGVRDVRLFALGAKR